MRSRLPLLEGVVPRCWSRKRAGLRFSRALDARTRNDLPGDHWGDEMDEPVAEQVDDRVGAGSGKAAKRGGESLTARLKGLYEGFPAALIAVLVVAAAAATMGGVARSGSEFGLFVALVAASLAGGGFVGWVIGGPGLGSGEDATAKANERGWADRLGILGNWLTGAAFVLVVARAGQIVDWFARMTRTIAVRSGGQGDTSFQYAVGAWMITAASLGFIIGFMQMSTTGRVLLGKAKQASDAAQKAEVAAESAERSAEAASVASSTAQVAPAERVAVAAPAASPPAQPGH